MTRRTLATFTVLILSTLHIGCTTETTDELPESGFYSLRIDATYDDCTPRRDTGEIGAVSVIALEEGLNTPFERQLLRQDVPWEGVLLTLPVAECEGVGVELALAPEQVDQLGFVVHLDEAWNVAAPCVAFESTLKPPESDCEAERQMTFTYLGECSDHPDGRCCFEGGSAMSRCASR